VEIRPALLFANSRKVVTQRSARMKRAEAGGEAEV